MTAKKAADIKKKKTATKATNKTVQKTTKKAVSAPKKKTAAAKKPVSKKTITTKVKLDSMSKKSSLPKKNYYFFGNGKAEGNAELRNLLGGKGANLAEMSSVGLPVPPGFTITTDICRAYYENSLTVPKEVDKELEGYVAKIEKSFGKKFGDASDPLLLSVRSGSEYSMPGMMDTVLNLGLNDESVEGLGAKTGNMKFALDNFRRFIQMFGDVVLSIDKELFEAVITKKKIERRIKQDSSLQINDLNEIIKKFKSIIKRKSGDPFPEEPYVQLRMARDAVFRSWNNPRAITYRRMNEIPSEAGTAVSVQAMVFGNMGNTSGTGVGFTRNPSTGTSEFFGEYLVNAQGEDVVAGIRTPQPIKQLKNDMPKVFKSLQDIATKLEKHYREIQDFEFTIQENQLYMLQTRNGERTVQAAVKIAVDMVKEKLITKEEAILRINPNDLDNLLHPSIDPKAKLEVIAKGLPASPGAASGKVYFTAEDAIKFGAKENVILVRSETNPDDVEGMSVAVGILTSHGGMTSHAAVIARGMGRCCVSGAEKIRVNLKKKQFQVGKLTIKEGEVITLNGSTGQVIMGLVDTIEPELSAEFHEYMEWADSFKILKVRTNADTPKDALQAVKFGAEGIGLCRTEHMFFGEARIPIVQDMILAATDEDRQLALDKLFTFQKKDFKGIFEALDGLPVTIRTLDPPLHEFLPRREEVELELENIDVKSDTFEEDEERLKRTIVRIDELGEVNPMLGHRGCRLGVVFPEITEMQTRAIIWAACQVAKNGTKVFPEIMIPLVGHINEFTHQKEVVTRIANEIIGKSKTKDLKYLVGTMIEIPRAALTADEIAAEADFFSFGTNDLTQLTFGYSRDDAGKYLRFYFDNDILPQDPFVSIDESGVGQLIEMAATKGRKVNPDLKLGICGEHGGDPQSIHYCHYLGLEYVSCSPYRVPIARLAAAQVAILEKHEQKKMKKKK